MSACPVLPAHRLTWGWSQAASSEPSLRWPGLSRAALGCRVLGSLSTAAPARPLPWPCLPRRQVELEGREVKGSELGAMPPSGCSPFSLRQLLASSVLWAQCFCTLRALFSRSSGTAALGPFTAGRHQEPRTHRSHTFRRKATHALAGPSSGGIHPAPRGPRGAQQCFRTMQTWTHRPALPFSATPEPPRPPL